MNDRASRREGRDDHQTEGCTANLQDLLNLGPVTARRLRVVGVHIPANLESVGAVEAFLMVEQEFPDHTTLVLLYALEGALRDVPWTTLSEEVKAELRQRVAD